MKSIYDVELEHYIQCWKCNLNPKPWLKGPTHDLPTSFSVLESAPTSKRKMWTYATCAMASVSDDAKLELHLFSPIQWTGHVELLTAIAHYHTTGHKLGLGHTVDFGRPWLPNSACNFGLISLPYLDGPSLELCDSEEYGSIQFLWLVPITSAEREFVKANGVEALEEKFESFKFNYVNPHRRSVV